MSQRSGLYTASEGVEGVFPEGAPAEGVDAVELVDQAEHGGLRAGVDEGLDLFGSWLLGNGHGRTLALGDGAKRSYRAVRAGEAERSLRAA